MLRERIAIGPKNFVYGSNMLKAFYRNGHGRGILNMRIGFVGLGKLGLPVAASIARHTSHDVRGYDTDARVKTYVSDQRVPYQEADLNSYLQISEVTVDPDIGTTVSNSDLLFIAVQTPHEPQYEGTKPTPESTRDFDYSFLKTAVEEVVRVLERPENRNHNLTLVVISTVLPGTMESEVFPILNPVRSRIRFCYNPFFIAMGTTIQDFMNPEFILLGERSPGDGRELRTLYRELHSAKVISMNIKSAELTKVAYNTFIGFKIVFANTIGEIVDANGGNADEVTDALSMATDRLMSGRYLSAGMADGGVPPQRSNCHVVARQESTIILKHL